jgi:nucleoside-diphosphate-sugar epimerase
MTTENRALVVGATGIAGGAMAERLLAEGWTVYGLSRKHRPRQGVTSLRADFLDPGQLSAALAGVDVSHVFFTAWSRRDTEQENIAVNRSLVRNVLHALEARGGVRHAALVTGLKHYMGPFEAYGTGEVRETPFHEDEPRLATENFYYAQEDELFAASTRQGFSWSVHRSHTIIGHAVGNAMNMPLTLATQAALCKFAGQRFVFPGSAVQWNGVTDMTDARLLTDHMLWASTTSAAGNEAYNVVNGDVFRWRWMWPKLAELLDVEPEGFAGAPRPLGQQMRDLQNKWPDVTRQHGLREPDVEQLASWWHTDAEMGRGMECLADMSKSRKAGYLRYQCTLDSFAQAFDRYRADRLIP